MKKTDLFMYILGGMIVICFFIILGMLVKIQIPVDNKDLLNITLGALIGAFSMIVSYFYGSSKGSADKSDTINTIMTDKSSNSTNTTTNIEK